MILKLQVTKVRSESYKGKDGKDYEAFDLICMDTGEGRRLGHSVTFSPDRTQREQVKGLDLRDKSVEVDVESVGHTPAGAITFRGFITNLATFNGGPLRIEKPAALEAALNAPGKKQPNG